MPFEIKYHMEQFTKTWGYTFYHPTADLVTANGLATRPELLNALLKLHTSSVKLSKISTRKVQADPGLEFPFQPLYWSTDKELTGTVNKPTAAETLGLWRPDVTQTSIPLEITCGERLRKRRMWLRGIPDDWVEREELTLAWKTPATLTQAITAFQNAIGPNGVGFTIRERLAFSPETVVSLESADNGANTIVVLASNHAAQPLRRWYTFRYDKDVLQLLGFAGTHLVLDIPKDDEGAERLNAFKINVRWRFSEATHNPAPMWAKQLVYGFNSQVVDMKPKRPRSRDTGHSGHSGKGRATGRSFRN